ncbi:hypothetical protein HELRODRAFT_183419 [Helobdella robusta]|uniref:C-type lectin domain-containing protein n=1 Tax=Helobdella robusta TaxID=6412 RepID=T1FJM0_HELRO|nr:hypothetical protein HELRODRAFT_183419 [Helobdella robusta]ESO11179.1 hypothetical protein HELRODRAFT_183419 [Helobdella robusta]
MCLKINNLFIFAILSSIFSATNKAVNSCSRQSRYHRANNTLIDVIDVRYNFSNGPPKNKSVFGIRSCIACSALCLSEESFACKGFECRNGINECKLVTAFLTGVSNSAGNLKERYRLKEACPATTTYVPSMRSCLVLIPRPMTWLTARDECNNMTLNFHPLIIDSLDTNLALKNYLNSYFGCMHPFPSYLWDDVDCTRNDFCVICQLDLY